MADASESKVKISSGAALDGDGKEADELKLTNAKSNVAISTTSEKKAFTKFLIGASKVMDAATQLQDVFVKDAENPKNHSVTAEQLVPLLSELKLKVENEQAKTCIDDADFDHSKKCEYAEFLIVVGLALQRHMGDDWAPPTEPVDLSSVKKCYDHILLFWNRLMEVQKARAIENETEIENPDELTIDTIKAMFSVSGDSSAGDVDDLTARRLKELDDDDDKSISLPEFFKTMFFWFGLDEDEE